MLRRYTLAKAIIHQTRAIEMWILSIYNDGTTKDALMKNASSNSICSIINILDGYALLQYLLFIKKMQNAENISIPRPR